MGRSPCCVKEGLNRGAWTAIEDKILREYIEVHGEGRWRNLPKKAGLKRCGKSCRLRWLNYLRPGIKRGNISPDEEELIIRLHKLLGNRWSLIAGRLPGRTDNEIKNYWNTILSKKSAKQKEAINGDSPSSSDSKRWDISNNVIQPKATKCSRVYLDPHLQNHHTNGAAAPPGGDVGETSPATYENLGFMSETNQDLEMGLTQEAWTLSEFLISDFSDLFHVNNGDERVKDHVLPSTSSVRQDPFISSEEFWLVEDRNFESVPFSSVLGEWLLE